LSNISTLHVSAPGKLMLLGEHAVVHGRPCLVTAVESRLHMMLTLTGPGDNTLVLHAPDVGIEHAQMQLADDLQAVAKGARFVMSSLAVFRDQWGLKCGLQIETRSDFSSQFGLGSSSATVACTLFGLAQLMGVDLDRSALFEAGLTAIRRVQQTGSGFDLAAAIYGGTLFYDTGQPRQIVPMNTPDLPLIAAYSGIKADTPTYVGHVDQLQKTWPIAITGLFDLMAHLVLDGRTALERADWAQLGQLMNIQHGLLHAIGVDTIETASLVFRARQAGAYGAKLSGAGGGDCIIALVPEDCRESVRKALEAAGGQILDIEPSAPGVRIEG
jgi:mevalonate kinase